MRTLEKIKCFHCGQPCEDESFVSGEKPFCCYGCKVIYEIISANDLCEYYDIQNHPGSTGDRRASAGIFSYLDEESVRSRLLEFDSSDFARVKFFIPAIHCSSCIWLLEHLERIDRGVLKSEVNFSAKSVTIDFQPERIKLSAVVAILNSIGYNPVINLEGRDVAGSASNLSLVLRLAVAGFCFGNVMLFSFPEYLGLDASEAYLKELFSWLNLALSIPVLVYSASGYFVSSYKSLKQKQLNIDVPIMFGLVALFGRSTWDIVTMSGPGYLDSFTGLVFFLLIGKWFQDRAYENLSFERDYRSYFPLAVQKHVDNEWTPVVVYELEKGDRIRVRNLEIVPADAILLEDKALIDYSFVSGEARPVPAVKGSLVYAGGRITGNPAELVVEKTVSQSHLTSLWNNNVFRKKQESNYRKVIDDFARRFTWMVIVIALCTGVAWYFFDESRMWLVVTSVLMVACPCALALAAPFTYGSMLRIFGRHDFYLKNADVIERLASVDAVVFDKTGTVTHGQGPDVKFQGELSGDERACVRILTSYSAHPLSSLIGKSIQEGTSARVSNFVEIPGKGIEGTVNGKRYKLGSAKFTSFNGNPIGSSTPVFVSIDDSVRGYFLIRTGIRDNMQQMIQRLGHLCFAMLSGDNYGDKSQMRRLFPAHVALFFSQQPEDKMQFIAGLQAQGKKVLMVGDGLNDAGALKQADVGIAVTDDAGLFTPACDGIISGNRLQFLDEFMSLARKSSLILKTAFFISFFYNAIALAFAVTGHLTPLVAAVLMPVSSVTVVSFSSLSVKWTSRNRFKTKQDQY